MPPVNTAIVAMRASGTLARRESVAAPRTPANRMRLRNGNDERAADDCGGVIAPIIGTGSGNLSPRSLLSVCGRFMREAAGVPRVRRTLARLQPVRMFGGASRVRSHDANDSAPLHPVDGAFGSTVRWSAARAGSSRLALFRSSKLVFPAADCCASKRRFPCIYGVSVCMKIQDVWIL